MPISKLKYIRISGFALLLVLKLALFQSAYLYAQTPNFRFNNIYKEDGLPSNTIKGIVKDKLGFLWIATTNGLCRYDAKGRMKVFKLDAENNRLQSSTIECIYNDSKGFLWIGTRQGGLTKIDVVNDVWTTYRYQPGVSNSLAHDEILCITEDAEGRIWIGTEGGANIFYPEEERFVTFRADKNDPTTLQAIAVLSILEDKNGMIWLGTWSGGLHLFLPNKADIEKSTFRNFMIPETDDHETVWSIYQDKDGRHWLGEEFGLVYMQVPADATNEASEQDWNLNFHIYKKKDDLSFRQLYSILQDSYGNLWYASLGGVNLVRREFLPDTKQLLNKTSEKPKLQIQNLSADEDDFFSVSNNIIYDLYEDNQQLIWLSTSKGLSQFDWRSRQFDFIQPAENSNARATIMTPAGIAFSINEKPYIYISDLETGAVKKIEPPRSRIDKEGFKGFQNNDDGSICILSNDGLGVYDMTTNTYRHELLFEDYKEYLNIGKSAVLRHLFYKNKFWIGGNKGLAVFDTERNEFKNYSNDIDDKQSLVNNGVSDFQLDNEGNLWVSTWGGISVITKKILDMPRLPDTLKFRNYDTGRVGTGFISNKVNSLKNTSKRMYISTENGMMSYEYDSGKFKDRTNGENVFSIYRVNDWGENDIWMSIEGGIVNYNLQQEIYKIYHSKYGINNINLRDSKSYKDDNGGLYFTGANTIIKLTPDSFLENETPPIVAITDAQILNKDGEISTNLIDTEQLELRYGDYRLALSFTALNYDSPEKNRYKYQLEGLDENWREAESPDPVVYTNLEAGTYTFKVIAANNNGVWNEEGASLKIIKKPAFWETNLFRAGLLLLTILAIFWGVRSYNRHLVGRYKEIESYNKKLNTEITERKKAEETLQIKNKELISTNKDLEQFAYICSHDLREPIRGVHSFINLIERNIMDDLFRNKTAPYFKHTYNYLKTLQNIITSLGIFTSVNKAENFTSSPVLINDIFKKVEANLMELVREKNAVLHFTDSTSDKAIYCSESALVLVLQNLVQNGIRYNTSNSPKVFVNVVLEDKEFLFTVTDNGIGIKEEYFEYIFKPFKTLENKSKTNSSGLGLAICNRIINQLGGKIWVKSTLGEGSTFYIALEKHYEIRKHEKNNVLI